MQEQDAIEVAITIRVPSQTGMATATQTPNPSAVPSQLRVHPLGAATPLGITTPGAYAVVWNHSSKHYLCATGNNAFDPNSNLDLAVFAATAAGWVTSADAVPPDGTPSTTPASDGTWAFNTAASFLTVTNCGAGVGTAVKNSLILWQQYQDGTFQAPQIVPFKAICSGTGTECGTG